MGEREHSGENFGEQFLNEKYPDLQKSPEVASASKRKEIRTGKKPKDKHERVEAHLERLEEIFSTEDESQKQFRINFLKDKLHDKFIIKEIPESYFKNQQKIAREQGHGDIEVTDQLREEAKKTITTDQEKSLDAWIDYLGSSDATYPNWLKYWAFRSIAQLSQYDKEAHEFKKRSKSTTAQFPDINREALAYVLDALEKKRGGQAEEITDEKWATLLKNENFAKLYAHSIEKITPTSEEEKENIQGQWVKYDQGSDAKPLYESLQGHGTGWCTAGESTAEAQLKLGDFYVYYTKNQQGEYKIPRITIRMQEGEIAEVRGINADQNLESAITDVAKEKMQTLPGGERYEKKVSDTKKLTEIENKFIDTRETEELINEMESMKQNDYEYIAELEKERLKNKELELTKDELRFLYEVDDQIEGFGYQKDPRIEEIISKRDIKTDLSFALDIPKERVSINENEALKGGILFHYGDINLFSPAENEELEFPERISGYVNLRDTTSIKGLKLPKYVGGYLHLNRLASAEGLKLPEYIGGDLYLYSLDSAEDLTLPKYVGGTVHLSTNLGSDTINQLAEQYPHLKIEV